MKATILVVDDDRVALTLLSKLVGKLECTALKATSGDEALKHLRQDSVDLIISDYDMPHMTGLDLLKQVRVEFPQIPFVLITAHSNLIVIREAWQHGAFDFFQKPVFVDRLNQTIRLAVDFGHLKMARRKFSRLEELCVEPDILDVGVIRELAVALPHGDLRQIVEEFETHARIELEHIVRLSAAKVFDQVKTLAHRLAGTSVNLGLIKFSEELRAIEKTPTISIDNPAFLGQILEKSIFWLHENLAQITNDLAS
jgi:CheY-like chemotaxis protein